ncbi:MAG: hypothetical protein ACXW30_06545 [Micavibrio sp.]
MKRIAIIAALTLTALLALTFFLFLPMTSQWQTKSLLRESGFTQARIEKAAKIPGGYSLENISLDNNQFSTIENVTLRTGKDGKTLTIDKMVLTGDWKKGPLPEIAGWSPPGKIQDFAKMLRKRKIETLILNGGQLDIALPWAGLIRLEAKGQMNLLPDGAIRLQAVLWSVQKQLKAEIQVNGEFAPNGLASIDFEVVDGRVSLEPFIASRLGGWLIINKTAENAPWSASAQLVAGAARLYGLVLNGLTLTAQGTLIDSTLTLQAGGKENDKLTFSADARLRKGEKNTLSSTLRADNIADLIQAVTNLSNDAETMPPPASATRPGAIVIYDSEAVTPSGLFANASIGLSDLTGKVWMKGAMRKTATGTDLDIQQASLKKLAAAFGINNLESNGMLTGLFTLSRDDKGALTIDQGLIRATEPAKLAYSGEALPASLQTTRKDALNILKLFAYDNLEMYISGPLSGQLEGDISMTGTPLTGTDQKATLITLHFKDQLLDE